MKSRFLLLLYLLLSMSGFSQTGTEGFYKDVFMDGGVDLYNKTYLPAADELGLTLEYIATDDELLQNERITGNEYDVNGILLYPDGTPRFRLLHTNGGSASAHGTSLDDQGRINIRTFYYYGGSYTGVCAGAFISSIHYQTSGINSSYYHIWPGRTTGTGTLNIYTGHFIEQGSPLLQYNNFGNNMHIPHIYHNGGCYANETTDFPPGTEILLRYDKPGPGLMNHKASCWAYKENDESGRLVDFGSHPEDETSGEGLELMKAILQYAIAGQGNLSVKGNLENGLTRVMDKTTEENVPAFTKIGDKQYHHFSLEIPEDVPQLSIMVSSQQGYHFNIYLNENDFAFRSNAQYSDTSFAAEKTLTVEQVTAGQYFVSVECETTVDAVQNDWGFDYVGNLEVLNGIDYTIKAEYSLGVMVDIKTFLEGPFDGYQMNTTLNGTGLLPLDQPYMQQPWNYNGSEGVESIPNTDVVDWVLVELRETSGGVATATPACIVGSKAGFLLRDGSVVSTDGSSPIRFKLMVSDNLFAVVYHRNHVGVISSDPLSLLEGAYVYDFTSDVNRAYGGARAHKQLAPGIWGLISGDCNSDGEINNPDKNEVWKSQNGFGGYYKGDMNMDGIVDGLDIINMWRLNAGRGSHFIE